MMASIEQARREMVADLARRGVTDRRVLGAMGAVPRELFVQPHQTAAAYEDHPLDIGQGQTISQPYMVAAMAVAAGVEPGDRVLEVGTGSGYGAAVLAALGARVWTIERHRSLAEAARSRLEAGGFDQVQVVVGDGSEGLAPEAPFDAIVVTAAPAEIPPALLHQLADGGVLVIPVGPEGDVQTLVRIRRRGDRFRRRNLGAVRFVPLVAE